MTSLGGVGVERKKDQDPSGFDFRTGSRKKVINIF